MAAGVTNPFQPATYNPFQAAKPPPPSINQLRAQNQFISPNPSPTFVGGAPAMVNQAPQAGMVPLNQPMMPVGTLPPQYPASPASNPFL